MLKKGDYDQGLKYSGRNGGKHVGHKNSIKLTMGKTTTRLPSCDQSRETNKDLQACLKPN